MTRIPLIQDRADVPPGGEAAWDAIAATRGHVAGPFRALLHRPELAGRVGHLGALVRFESGLDPVDRELAILAVARGLDCRYEWAAHAPLARRAGVREAAIAAIRDRRALDGLTAREAGIVGYTQALFQAHRIDRATFDTVAQRLGVGGLVELTATVGYYAMLACTLNAFEVAPDPGGDDLPA
jgi:4-carboxymuconolactone decarboxylase